MEVDNCFFGDVRRQAFQLWKQDTNRDCQSVNDDIRGSYECKWQDRATDLGYIHISIFCSLGEWANNISDILKDETYDYYDFLINEHRLALFRYYTRLLLVVSEMLCDFEDIVQKVEPSPSSKEAREFLSVKKGEVDSLFSFINNVCKHKVKRLHKCNHHLPIWFEDCMLGLTFISPISIDNLKFGRPDGILIPKLSYFVQVILNCYACLEELFVNEPNKFKMICDEYNGISCDV